MKIVPVQNEAHIQHPSSSSRTDRLMVSSFTFSSQSQAVNVTVEQVWSQDNLRKTHLYSAVSGVVHVL